MRILKKNFLIIVLVFPLLTGAQDKNEELLEWNLDRKLAWADYKGNPDPSSDAAASTATYLGIEYYLKGGNFSYKITCYFSKDKSWGLAKTEYILSHEQGHFDIAEIFARKLNKKMNEYRFDKNTYEVELEKIYDNILEEKEKIQNQYDAETDYSRKKDKQAEWLKKINTMLEELISYANYH